jgi:hypothetical protein
MCFGWLHVADLHELMLFFSKKRVWMDGSTVAAYIHQCICIPRCSIRLDVQFKLHC